MEIKGGVAVVTGGASGLGEATVRYLLGKGGQGVDPGLCPGAG